MSELVVSTAFTAKGSGVESALIRQAKAADTMGARLRAAFKSAAKESSVFKSMLSANLLSNAISTMTSAVTRGVRTATTEFIGFDAAIRAAADTGKIELEPGTAAFNEFAQAARQLATSSKFSATAGAEALGKLGEAGFTAEQAMAALPQIAQFATGSNLELAAAADVASSAMQAFGLASTDSATLTMNLSKVNDILAMSADQSKMSSEDFIAAMKSSGPALSAAGMSLETYTALLGKMTLSGMDGADAGSKLNFMMKGLAAPTAAAKKATAALGISMYDEKGQMRDLIDFIADYERATAGQTDAQRNANTAVIFGKRGLDGVNAVLGLGVDGLKEYRDQLQASGGTAAKEAKVIEKTLGYKVDVLKNSAIELGFQLVEAFAGEGKDGLDKLIKAVKEFDMKPIISAAEKLWSVFKWGITFISDHAKTIATLVATFAALKITLGAISFVQVIAGFAQMMAGATAAATAATAAGAAGAAAGGATPKPGAGAGVVAGGVIAAAGIGYAIGSFFEEEFFAPMREQGAKLDVNLGNLVYKFGGKGGADFAAMAADDPAKLAQQAKAMYGQIQTAANTPAIASMEDAAAQVIKPLQNIGYSVGEFFGFLSADQAALLVENNKSPIETQRQQIEQLSAIYMQMAMAVLAAKLQIEKATAEATTEINVNVANAPAGTTVDAKGSTGAPKVNQGAAGKV